MKKFRKLSSVLMAILFLFAMVTPAGSVGIDLDETIHTGGMNDLNVRQTVRDYMDTRAAYLLGETETMDWLVTGIADDEAAHKECLEENGILITDITYDIVSVNCSDAMAIAEVVETLYFYYDGISKFSLVTHRLTILGFDSSTVIVAADEYYEDFSSFISCSYLPEEDIACDMTSATSTNGSPLCIIKIARGEDGVTERDVANNTNDNKYGEDLGCNFAPWCSIFIRWCAVEANISDAVIPLKRFCKDLKSYYVNLGLYHPQKTNGKYYTPQPGDILFIGTSEDNSTHVGIVERFEDNEGDNNDCVWIIDGNSIDDNGEATRVNYRSVKLKRSDILGYASPLYTNAGHSSNVHVNKGDSHGGTCINCGVAFEEEHCFSYTDNGGNHSKVCNDCNLSIVESHVYYYEYLNINNHRAVCSGCMHLGSTSQHIFFENSDGTNQWQECIDCAYKKGIGGPISGL